MLKLNNLPTINTSLPAAFRRLCVETVEYALSARRHYTAAFRRLCVETADYAGARQENGQPPSGGCVLKRNIGSG